MKKSLKILSHKKNVPGIVDQTIPGCSREKRGKKNEKRMLALLLALLLYRYDIKKLSLELLNKCEVMKLFTPFGQCFIAVLLSIQRKA